MAIENEDKNLHLSPILDQIKDHGPSDSVDIFRADVAKTDFDTPVAVAPVPEAGAADPVAMAAQEEPLLEPGPGPAAPTVPPVSSRGLPRVLLLAFLAAVLIVGALRWNDLQPVRSAAARWVQQYLPESERDLQGVQVRLMEVELRLRQLETDLTMLHAHAPPPSADSVTAEPAPQAIALPESDTADENAEAESLALAVAATQSLPGQFAPVAEQAGAQDVTPQAEPPELEAAPPTVAAPSEQAATETLVNHKSWSVVLISLLSREQAQRWVESFDYQRHPLDIVEIQLGDKTYYRVRVGNLAGRTQAVEVMNQLKREAGRQDAWVSYD